MPENPDKRWTCLVCGRLFTVEESGGSVCFCSDACLGECMAESVAGRLVRRSR